MCDNHLSTTDRLMEFGLSMALSQHMIQVMNQAMQQMQVPNSAKAPSPTSNCYIVVEGKPVGPISTDTLLKDYGRFINGETLAWMPSMSSWKPIKEIPELNQLLLLLPPSLPNNP